MKRLIMGICFAAALASPALAETDAGTDTAVSTPTAPSPFGIPPAGVAASTAAAVDISSPTVAVSSGAAEAPAPPKRPWVLGEIVVVGNKNVKPSVVRGQVKAKRGDLYDRPDLDRDIQAILGLGNFERVAVDVAATSRPVPEHFRKVSGSTTTVRLTIYVTEKPLIKKIKIEGNKKIGKGALLDAIALKQKDPLDPVKLREDEDKILDKYHEKGYLDAVVASTVTKDMKALQAEIAFKVEEGVRSKIFWVQFTGVKAIKVQKLWKQMKNRRKKVYVQKELKDDLSKVERYYLNRGYLDVKLSTPTVWFSEDKQRIYIDVGISEGRAYKFGVTTFSGHAVYVSSTLAKAVEYRRGKVFNQEKYEETVRGIQDLYAEVGRLRARVHPVKTFNEKTDQMDVHFNIAEGEPVFIGHVDVEGNKATKRHVLKREVVVKPGDMFRASRVRKSREKIMNLGFIDDVDVDVQPSVGEEDKVDLTFDVVEGKPGILTAGAAYSSLDGFIGTLSLQHLNLFGRAQRASAQWSFGRRVQDYSISWTTPWVGNHPTSLGLDLFNTRRINPFENSFSAYVEKNRGGTIRVGPRFEEDKYHLNLSYTLSQISITNVQEQFKDRLAESTSFFSSLGAEIVRDTRDNIWDPTNGTRNSIGAQLAGGPLQGDIHFFKPSIGNSAHWKLFEVNDWPIVLSAINRAGYITQFGETKEVPVFNRFYVGGQDTLRGYAPNGEAGYPSGGKLFDVFNLELGIPLARERHKTIVKFVLFVDAGSSWDRVRDFSARVGSGTRDIKTDAGFGIRFVTPAFPIRLDWGYGFNHRGGEKLYQINFGLGNLF